MHKEIIITEDGSHTIFLPEQQITYHSTHGAVQESNHVFIQAGLEHIAHHAKTPIRIFEMGFGTGLNAFLTAKWAEKHGLAIQYTAVDLFPLSKEESAALNYTNILEDEHHYFKNIHAAEWGMSTDISPCFQLLKQHTSLLEYIPEKTFDLIYFDAFAPLIQPELWTTEVFIKLNNLLNPEGALTTYCSKSDVRRSMVAAGFTVEKIPGPPHKREMVRAVKK